AAARVIILSANDDEAARQAALDNGADGFLVKLPPRDDLIAAIRDAAQPRRDVQERAQERGEIERSAAHQRPQRMPVGGVGSDEDTLDRSVLIGFRQAGGRADFIRTLIDHFLTEAASTMEELRDSIARRDARAVSMAAHTLKGMAQTIGARKLGA